MGQICNEAPTEQTKLEYSIKPIQLQENSYQVVQGESLQDTIEPIIKEFKNEELYQDLTSNNFWRKHRQRQEYYLGSWQQGQMKGNGIIFVPYKYAYYGSFDKKPHGSGKLIFFDRKITYQGEIVRGSIEGEGKVCQHQGLFEFSGKISDGQPKQGHLKVYNPQTKEKKFTAFLTDYPEPKAEIDYNDHRHYQGQINTKSFMPEGQGAMQYPNQTKYQGSWREGKYHGEGILKWADGSEYNGQYSHGLKHGKGRLTYPSKRVYEGQWFNGKQEGEGTLYSEEGAKLQQGNWKAGQFCGQGSDKKQEDNNYV